MSDSLTREARVRGSLFGLAYGDALAAKAEFMDVPDILARWPGGPRDLEDPALVSDDTQMALAVGEALITSFAHGPSVDGITAALSRAFADWFQSSDNTRAPGLTCLGASARLSQGFHWLDCTVVHSKGCGANMRVAPVALLALPAGGAAGDATLSVSTLAQLQAALTHGHPTALAAADATATAIELLLSGTEPTALIDALIAHADAQQMTYHDAWLGTLWERTIGVDGAVQFIARGWQETLRALERAKQAAARADRHTDPCDQTGSGWVAEEALATALLCFSLYPDDPVAALNRAAVTRGDSDSIAAIAGALAGAHLGFDAWPEAWYDRIEYRSRLDAMAAGLLRVAR